MTAQNHVKKVDLFYHTSSLRAREKARPLPR